jgi:hypothetical protein
LGDQVGEPEPSGGAGQASRADDQAKPALLGREHVLDRDPRPVGVAAGEVRWHGLAARLRALELRHQPAPRGLLATER